MALTAAASPSNLPQSSTGRFEVTSVLILIAIMGAVVLAQRGED